MTSCGPHEPGPPPACLVTRINGPDVHRSLGFAQLRDVEAQQVGAVRSHQADGARPRGLERDGRASPRGGVDLDPRGIVQRGQAAQHRTIAAPRLWVQAQQVEGEPRLAVPSRDDGGVLARPPRVPAAGRWRRGRSRRATRRGGCPPSCPSPGAPARAARSVPVSGLREMQTAAGVLDTDHPIDRMEVDAGRRALRVAGLVDPTVVPGLQRDHMGLVGCEPLLGEGDQGHLPAVSGEAHPLARAQQPLHGPQPHRSAGLCLQTDDHGF